MLVIHHSRTLLLQRTWIRLHRTGKTQQNIISWFFIYNSQFSFTGLQNERVVWFQTSDCSPVTFQLVVFSSSHPRDKSHWTLNVSAHIIISKLCVWLHRRTCRAAPVHDGRQEGGQHVLHDLVHQLVLNRFWYDRLKTLKMLTWAGGGGECGRCVHEPTGNPKRGRRCVDEELLIAESLDGWK